MNFKIGDIVFVRFFDYIQNEVVGSTIFRDSVVAVDPVYLSETEVSFNQDGTEHEHRDAMFLRIFPYSEELNELEIRSCALRTISNFSLSRNWHKLSASQLRTIQIWIEETYE